MKIISRLFISLIAVSAISSNAALYDRGNGMIYDSSQNITWLQDANYAFTSGYDNDNTMTWQQATNWTANLVYGGFSDWRLPSAGIIGDNNLSYDGSTDRGYNNTRSEIGHLFLELGNKAVNNIAGKNQSGNGWLNSTFTDAGTNQNVSFLNVQKGQWFWEAETFAQTPANAWIFDHWLGEQHSFAKTFDNYPWAVRDGDVEANGPDGDGVFDVDDNCPLISNDDQLNTDGDSQGDVCDLNDDNDAYIDAQEAACGSDSLNAASVCYTAPVVIDTDLDGILDSSDNCPPISNAEQTDSDDDGQGNACDDDDDNDGISDEQEAANKIALQNSLNTHRSELASLLVGKESVLAQYEALTASATAQQALANATTDAKAKKKILKKAKGLLKKAKALAKKKKLSAAAIAKAQEIATEQASLNSM
jgi:hypothetical protein